MKEMKQSRSNKQTTRMKGTILFQVRSFLIAAFLVSVLLLPDDAAGHGVMWDPTSRSSMWHLYSSYPPNYSETSLYCGGKDVQYNEVNQGRCGECGDEWSIPRPRQNDEGGKYGKGIIARNYTQGDLVQLQVNLTASHYGHFEFRLCADKKSVDELVTQECLDKHLLQFEDGTTEFPILDVTTQFYYPRVQLPRDVNCEFCVMQWTYVTGNSPGSNPEIFVNCADVAIRP